MLLLLLFVGAAADYGRHGKKAGLVSATLASSFFVCLVWLCSLVLFPGATVVALAASFFICASLASGLTNVYYQSFFPILVRHHPEVLSGASTAHVIFHRLSSFSTALMFAGGIFGLLVAVGIVSSIPSGGGLAFGNVTQSNNSSNVSIANISAACASDMVAPPTWGQLTQQQAALTFAAAILVLCALPAFFLVHERSCRHTSTRKFGQLLIDSWRSLARSWTSIRARPSTFVFLVAYFFYWNGLSTLLFASTLLLQTIVSTQLVGVCVVLAFAFAGVSSILLMLLQKHFPRIFSHKNIIFTAVFLACGLPFWTFFGLTTAAEAICSSIYFGTLLGAALSSIRAAFAQMIPAKRESEFWTIFALVSQASAFVGPLVIVFVNEASCSLRLASFSVLGFCVLGLAVLIACDFDRAYGEAAPKGK
jgi:MFS-type transporter involved in bile tolerance (Atg22 family)